MYSLTEEGKKYLESGLPEKNLVALLGKPITIEQARKKVDGFAIALSWAKKNKWIRIEGNKITLVRKPGKTIEEEAMEAVSRGDKPDSRAVKILLKRRLVREERDDDLKKARRMIGKQVANLSPELIKTGLWKKVTLKKYDVSITGSRIYPGKRHPYNSFLDTVRDKLFKLGFKEMTGPHIELEFWNFDALYQAQNHPSRDWTQTYSLKTPKKGSLPGKGVVGRVKATHENGWKTGSSGWGYKWDPEKAARLMPRAHTTACSARQLSRGVDVPGKYFAISRCFRPDVIDATHGVEFNQCEGIVIDPSLNFRNLLGLLKTFALEVAGAEEVRFFPDYYPFTEPSVQLSAKHPEMGWVEFAGAGIFREELTRPLGIEEPVIAWGLGIDRLAMFRLKINDIRELFTQNLGWLRESRVVVER